MKKFSPVAVASFVSSCLVFFHSNPAFAAVIDAGATSEDAALVPLEEPNDGTAAAASVSIDATPEAAASVPSRRPRKLSAKKKANTLPVPVPSTPAPPTPAPIAPVVPPTDEPTEEPSTLSPTDGLPPCDDLDGEYFTLVEDPTTGLFDCALIYFDTAESLESFCGMEGMTCDSSKKCPELGFTLLFESVSYPPGSNLFGWTCGVSYISPEKPVAPCCETGSWLTCNHDRCESEYTKDFFCPDVDDHCNGFDDCFRDVCDCDEAKNDVCKWAQPDTPLPPSCDGQGDGQYFTVPFELLTKYECGIAYFDSAESLESYCEMGFGVTCDSSKKCPELGFTELMESQSFPPGNQFGWTCGVSYISPEKPVAPCCETGSWLTCNFDRCESENTKDFFCPDVDSYCNGFDDCFRDVCDCDEAKNDVDVCKWAEPDTPLPPSCDGQGDGQYFTVQKTKYECGIAYFDSAESKESYCEIGFVTCDDSKTCPELGYTLVGYTQKNFPPGHPLEGGCALDYSSPEKPVPPCCETGLWSSCNVDRCESEKTKDFFCPGFTDDNEYCDGFNDCFGADVCDCDDAKNSVCKWAEPDTPAPTDAPTM